MISSPACAHVCRVWEEAAVCLQLKGDQFLAVTSIAGFTEAYRRTLSAIRGYSCSSELPAKLHST